MFKRVIRGQPNMKRNRYADSDRFKDSTQFRLRDEDEQPLPIEKTNTWLSNHWFHSKKGKRLPSKKEVIEGLIKENIIDT
jgi:hypothetical protein